MAPVEATDAVAALGALAQPTRLAAYRLLVQAGSNGLAAGEIADVLMIAASSLSFHLAHLMRAGLINQERRRRSLIYSANYFAMNELVDFLTENCCGGEDCSQAMPGDARAA